jgi:hypothetical protein
MGSPGFHPILLVARLRSPFQGLPLARLERKGDGSRLSVAMGAQEYLMQLPAS